MKKKHFLLAGYFENVEILVCFLRIDAKNRFT